MRFLLSQEFSTVVQRLEHPTVYGEGMGSSPIGTANCSISIVASASDFLSEDKGSIPL